MANCKTTENYRIYKGKILTVPNYLRITKIAKS